MVRSFVMWSALPMRYESVVSRAPDLKRRDLKRIRMVEIERVALLASSKCFRTIVA